MAHILVTDFNSNPNIGLYAFATDEYCLVGTGIPAKSIKEIEETLKVPVHAISICGTSMAGVFCAGNSGKLLVPGIAFDSELRTLRKLGLDYDVVETRLTALGNNILCNDKGAIASPDLEKDCLDWIRESLGVPVIAGKIAGLDIVGSLAALNSRGFCLVHHDIASFEKKLLERHLGVTCTEGTVNMGSPYVSSGILANKCGFVIGSFSGGPEIDNADKALGFI